jgi:hypothetical protein
VKQLDSAVAKARACRDLFTPDIIELRSQLSYLCVKSMGADPIQCRRRAEELLWKKCYYDVITSTKINGKVITVKNFYFQLQIKKKKEKKNSRSHPLLQWKNFLLDITLNREL